MRVFQHPVTRRYGLLCLISYLIWLDVGCMAGYPNAFPALSKADRGQRAVFASALEAYDQVQYDLAEKRFQEMIARYPGSPLLEEVQWMLGRTYERKGEAARAVSLYRAFLSNYPESPHRLEAELRTELLKEILQDRSLKKNYPLIRGAELEEGPKPDPSSFSSRLASFRQHRFNTLVLTVDSENRDVAPVMLPREAGFRIMIRLVVSSADLFKPQTQEHLTQFLGRLADQGAEGLFFDIQGAFTEKNAPSELTDRFLDEFRPGEGAQALAQNASLRWQWLGWRGREMVKRMKDLLGPIFERHPNFYWGILFPPEAVTAPHLAITDTGLDLLEAKRVGADYFGIRGTGGASDQDLMAMASDRIGDPARVVLIVSSPPPLSPGPLIQPAGHGLLYLQASAAPSSAPP